MLKKTAIIPVLVIFIIFVKIMPVRADQMEDAIKANYLALKESVQADPGKDSGDFFDPDIEAVKRDMGIGYNFGNSLDWAFKNNKVRRYKIRISIGYYNAEYYYYETYVSMTGNLYAAGIKPEEKRRYAEFHLTPAEGYTPRSSDPINILSISLSNEYPEATGSSVTMDVKFLQLLDENGNELIKDKTCRQEYVVSVRPYPIQVLMIPLDTTVGELDRDRVKLQADIQLDHFISDYKNNPKMVYKESYNGEPAADEQLRFLKAQGFRTIRLPVTWYAHMDSTGTVDPEWFEEVRRIVDRVLSYDFFVIVNIHHDGGRRGWIKANETDFQEHEYLYRYLVLQIAENFKHYGEKLILSGVNEITNMDKIPKIYRSTAQTDIETFNRINQIFVDEVRSTGYGNTNRLLMVGIWYANVKNLSDYRLPLDQGKNRILTEIHDFPVEDETTLRSLDFLEETDGEELAKYNLVMSEFGMLRSEDAETRIDFMRTHVDAVYRRYGIPMIVWDDGGNYILMDRKNAEWDRTYQSDRVAEAMLSAFFGE